VAIPRQADIELPLLRVLTQMGGQGRPRDVYPLLELAFPDLTDADKAETLPQGAVRWKNTVQWTRQRLIEQGMLENAGWGLWKVSELGRRRVTEEASCAPPTASTSPPNLEAIWEAYESAVQERLLERLLNLTATQFEQFAPEFLRAYGFTEMQVTGVGPDGGIDGYGRLRVGVASMRIAFQCKRWADPVGRPEVDRFRGAIQGEFEQGMLFTTSRFTRPALDASFRRGAVPIILIDGDQLVASMMEKGIGVARRPLYLFEEISLPGAIDDE
jgi:restriction endonuclease Mrr